MLNFNVLHLNVPIVRGKRTKQQEEKNTIAVDFAHIFVTCLAVGAGTDVAGYAIGQWSVQPVLSILEMHKQRHFILLHFLYPFAFSNSPYYCHHLTLCHSKFCLWVCVRFFSFWCFYRYAYVFGMQCMTISTKLAFLWLYQRKWQRKNALNPTRATTAQQTQTKTKTETKNQHEK